MIFKDKKIYIIAITKNGKELAKKINKIIPQTKIFTSVKNFFEKAFNEADFIIAIMATGIVVRKIAPLIKSKLNDPGIVVLDEKGKYAISLLSGHIGGANELAKFIEKSIGAKAIITTATDVNKKISIDLIAKENCWKIFNPEFIKFINMAILNNEKIAGNFPIENYNKFIYYRRLKNLLKSKIKHKVVLSNIKSIEPKDFLLLLPENIYIGIGCNRGTGLNEIEEVIFSILEKLNRRFECVKNISTFELKKDEKALLDFSEKYNIPLIFYTKDELNQIKNVKKSNYLINNLGVIGVCEPASILSAKRDLKKCMKMKKLLPKIKKGNVTISIHEVVYT